jgi:hypothetical protein
MKVFEIAYYYQGHYGLKDVKFATVIASNIHEAQAKWLTTDSNALIIDNLCKDLTKASV